MSTDKIYPKLVEKQFTKPDSVAIKNSNSRTPVGTVPSTRNGGLDPRTRVTVTDDIIEATGRETNLDHKNRSVQRPRNSRFFLEKDDDPANKRGSPVEISHPQGSQSPNVTQNLGPERVPYISGVNPTPKSDLQKSDFEIDDAPLPSYYEPHGPGDTWTCPYNGCSRKIWGARDVLCIHLIKEHFLATHAGKVADLVHQESRPEVSIE